MNIEAPTPRTVVATQIAGERIARVKDSLKDGLERYAEEVRRVMEVAGFVPCAPSCGPDEVKALACSLTLLESYQKLEASRDEDAPPSDLCAQFLGEIEEELRHFGWARVAEEALQVEPPPPVPLRRRRGA